MRIALATRHRDHVGGVETYLERLLPELQRSGHDLLLWHECPGRDRRIAMPPESAALCVMDRGPAAALEALRRWKPSVVFSHGLSDPALERALQAIGPSVLMLHTYHGTCVGGSKTFSFPHVAACARRLGPGCLVAYFPRRCGGLSPVTMLRRFRTESEHCALLPLYSRVAVLSHHMRDEAVRHGADADRVQVLPAPIDGPPDSGLSAARRARLSAVGGRDASVRLLFLGRLEPAKGGPVLVEAAPLVAERLGRHVELAIVGDGRCRQQWERLASAVNGHVTISFPGHADAEQRNRWFEWADLLVVPSLWPEPFGLVGAEAAAAGLPSVAFDVGGTRDWLEDGRTGRLVGTLDARALADGVLWAIEDASRLQMLCASARARAARWSMADHAARLTAVLQAAVLHANG